MRMPNFHKCSLSTVFSLFFFFCQTKLTTKFCDRHQKLDLIGNQADKLYIVVHLSWQEPWKLPAVPIRLFAFQSYFPIFPFFFVFSFFFFFLFCLVFCSFLLWAERSASAAVTADSGQWTLDIGQNWTEMADSYGDN